MPYDIEVMSLGADIYPLLDRVAAQLNGIQDQFRFQLTAPSQRAPGLLFERSEYVTSEIWRFLQEQRTTFGGRRPYIIAFVENPLRSSKLRNIFGAHEATEGLAVVTTSGAGQYVREMARYCSYYLVRYALSFVNPSIKAHNDPGRASCYFHQKIYKPEIRASMDSGYICDECYGLLQSPPQAGSAHRLSSAEDEALSTLRKFVSGDLPQAIVMKGGGVKGLAFAGALVELEKYFWFDKHVGTSAGSIAAVLLASSYSPSELSQILLEKDFRDFKDARIWSIPFNLFFRSGCFPGNRFQNWISSLLRTKFPQLDDIKMSDLNGALVYASQHGSGTIRFDSAGERRDVLADFAVRCSMSIPIFFQPPFLDGRRVYDGGLRNNFPLARFLNDHPRSNFIALYLGKPTDAGPRSMVSELLDIWIDGEERNVVDDNSVNVVVIDTSPVGTVDFNLSDIEKEFLLKVGKASALRFLLARNLDDGPSQTDVELAQREAADLRTKLKRSRRLRAARNWLILLGGIAILEVLHLIGLF